MANNYRGFFWGFDRTGDSGVTENGIQYRVDLISNTASTYFTEIRLAGERPVVLTYDTSETPFDPMRASRLMINVVVDSYLEDILPSKPQEVQVVLYNITKKNTEWVGWLSPMVLSANYRDQYETFELQANDCLKILQYLPYELVGDDIDFVSFRDILAEICDRSGLLQGWRWPMSKAVSGATLYPEQLVINEKNFYYSDVEETLKLDEVLTEMCKYVGMTAVQMGEHICLIDYQSLGKNTSHRMVNYHKASSYERGASNYLGGTVAIDQSYVSGPDPAITIEPIRNKIEVHDNFYKAEYFIPSPFDDEMLTNRLSNSNFYYTREIRYYTPKKPTYPDGTRFIFGQKYAEDADDSNYRYFHRVYDHDLFESVYDGSNRTKPINYDPYVGGTIVDFAAVRNDYVNDYGQTTVANKRDFTRYLMIRQNNTGVFPINWGVEYSVLLPTSAKPMDYPVFSLKSGYTADVMLGEGSYLVISANAMFERYDRPYINPDWTKDGNKITWTKTGLKIASAGCLAFVLGIGDKYWNGKEWQNTRTGFWVPLERTQEEYPFWQTDSPILNNVRWDSFINADGYKIPLDGVDTTGTIVFDVLLPSLQWYFNGASYNGYCWIHDLSIKAYKQGQDADMTEEEKDFITSNIIESGSVQEMSTIELKITTANDKSNPSWSDCIYDSGTERKLLQTVYESAISTAYHSPELNIVRKYVDQYSTLTKRISMDLPLSITQLNRLTGVDVDGPNDPYVILGTEIDYSLGSQRVEMIKKN